MPSVVDVVLDPRRARPLFFEVGDDLLASGTERWRLSSFAWLGVTHLPVLFVGVLEKIPAC